MDDKWHFNIDDKSEGVRRKLADGINSRIFFGDKVMLSVVEFEPNSKGKIHAHPEEQWGMLLRGSCKRIQGEDSADMKVGDFWKTVGNTPHTIHAGPEGATVLDIFSPVREDYKISGEGFGSR